MMNVENFRIVLVTINSQDAARACALKLVEERLIACCTVVPGVTSIYRWNDRVEESSECLLILKTTTELLERCETCIRELHPYEVPEIVSIAVDAAHPPYAAWMLDALSSSMSQ